MRSIPLQYASRKMKQVSLRDVSQWTKGGGGGSEHSSTPKDKQRGWK